jgi:hypothetical protein
MEKIHIALVGGQQMPIYFGILQSEAEKVVLIYSQETEKSALSIAENILRDWKLDPILVKVDPFDFLPILDEFNNLIEEYPDYEIEANISGGTKPWSIAMTMLAESHQNINLFYIDQNCNIYNLTQRTKFQPAPIEGGIEQILLYNGSSEESHTDFESYTEEDLDTMNEIKKIRKAYPKEFNAITIPNKQNKRRYNLNKKDRIEIESSSIEWDTSKKMLNKGKQEVLLSFCSQKGEEKFKLSSPHAYDLVTSSGWFEYEVATVLRKWPQCKEVWLNVIFPYNNKNPKNEIDIIVNVGYKLLFVECKTQIYGDRMDVDKFASAVKNYGGLGAKAIFITQQNMDRQTIERCDTNKIAHFCFYDEEHKPVAHKILFDLLDKQMQISNTR